MQRKSLSKLCACFMISLGLKGFFINNAFGKQSMLPNPSEEGSNDSLPINDKEKPTPISNQHTYKAPSKSSNRTLAGIVQEAISDHPSIAADKEALNATTDVIDQATAGYKPIIDLRASIGRESTRRNFQINALNPLESVGAITTTRTDPSIAIRQILFDGMGTASRVARAQSQHHQAQGALGVTTDTAMVDAATAVIDVRRLQRLVRVANHNIRFHQIMKQKVADIVQAGAAPISDLFQVEARLQDTLVSKTNIQSDLDVATAKFIEVVGKEPSNHIRRTKLPSRLTDGTVEMAVRMALDNNNTIKVARSNVQIAENSNRESASKLVPTLSLELEGERDRNMSATSGYQSRLTAMLVAKHNLYNGGADLAKSRETVKRLTEAHARLTVAIRQTERTIRAAWSECNNSRRKSTHLTKLIHEKRRIRDTYLNEFSLGKRTLIDILDAANDVFITEANRTSVDATADINSVILSVGTGQFGPYIKNDDGHDDGDELETSIDPVSDLPYSESNLLTTPYTDTDISIEQKPQNVSRVKKTSQKRKSIFEQRKEERENSDADKSSA